MRHPPCSINLQGWLGRHQSRRLCSRDYAVLPLQPCALQRDGSLRHGPPMSTPTVRFLFVDFSFWLVSEHRDSGLECRGSSRHAHVSLDEHLEVRKCPTAQVDHSLRAVGRDASGAVEYRAHWTGGALSCYRAIHHVLEQLTRWHRLR